MRRHSYTLEQFTASTCLLPAIIGMRVADRRGLDVAESDTFAAFVEQRSLELFNRNQRFRRKLLGPSALEYLYMFAEHWLDGQLERKERGIR